MTSWPKTLNQGFEIFYTPHHLLKLRMRHGGPPVNEAVS